MKIFNTVDVARKMLELSLSGESTDDFHLSVGFIDHHKDDEGDETNTVSSSEQRLN
jgi:hypothetical protein